MSTLVIHDVFPYLYKGMSERSTSYNRYTVKRFPVGGIKYLIRQLIVDLSKGSDIAFCFDSGRSIRKQKMASYKSGRTFSAEIVAQAEALYEYFEAAGLPVYKELGYEADDLIYSICRSTRESHTNRIVCGNDYDLTHNVDYETEFRSISTTTNSCDWSNFSTSVVAGQRIPLNTISAYKTIFGDSSDKYMRVEQPDMPARKIFEMYLNLLKTREVNGNLPLELSRSKEFLMSFVNLLEQKEFITKDSAKALRLNAEIAFPMYVEKDYKFLCLNNADSYTKMSLAKLAIMCGETDFPRLLGAGRVIVDDIDREFFVEKARYLESGEVMADNGLPLSLSGSFTDVAELRGV